jgi:hypothetical protein
MNLITEDSVDPLSAADSFIPYLYKLFTQVLRRYQLASADQNQNPIGMVYRMNRIPDRPINLCFQKRKFQKENHVKLA